MPTLKHLKASKHPNIALAELSLFLTPHRYRKGERLVAKQTDFDDVHRSIAQDMYMYIARPRRNYVLPRSWWYQDLAPCYSYLLGAANLDARIEFSKIAVDALRQHREFYAEPIFFVTVCPRKYVYPIERASQADLHGLRQTTRQALAGLSFAAMIDFALFKSWGKDRLDDMHNRVGVHIHALVFGATREQIDAALDAMGDDFRDIGGRRAGYCMRITARQLEGYFRYTLKVPLKHYNAKSGERRWYNAETEEWETGPRLGSQPLRPGDQLRMAAVMHEMRLDELLFGQGAGTALAREIRDRAREPIRRRNFIARMQGRGPDFQIPIASELQPSDRAPLSALVYPTLNRLTARYPKKGGGAPIVGDAPLGAEHLAFIEELNRL